MKIKIYFGIIILLTCFLIYAVFFMKSDYITDETLPPTVAVKQVTIGDTNIKTYTPDFLPKPIPEDVLKGSEENDFYYYLFLNPNKKTIFYQYKTGSKSPEDSETFHKDIENYLGKVLIDGNYKNYWVTDKGAKIYERRILQFNKTANYVPGEGDSKALIKQMEDANARIEAVKNFYKECAKTMCIINNKTHEYVVIDKRNVDVAKKALEDYKRW